MPSIEQQLASELQVKPAQISATLDLLDQGATVPFIARYRKEATGGLDDTQLRQLAQRLEYLRDLDQRRQSIIKQLQSQQQLTPELQQALLQADNKARLEDLYQPYRPKRRSKAQDAQDAGLQPLADRLEAGQAPNSQALSTFIAPERGIHDAQQALQGAAEILLERWSEQADLLTDLRQRLWREGVLRVRALRGKADEQSKFRDYFDYQEALRQIPSHRALAILRGIAEGVLKASLDLPSPASFIPTERMSRLLNLRQHTPWLAQQLDLCWQKRLLPRLETALINQMREQAETAAITVFSRNLRDLLLSAPAGAHITLGLDPGYRTGVKVAVVGTTGELLATDTLYPHAPQRHWSQALERLAALVDRYQVQLIAIGNGTASRETQQLVKELLSEPRTPQVHSLLVSEAGASVYSASALAAAELPQLDVSLRGAVSIARRLQDPLAELVKIDPRSIGVGQYQHDVNQKQLAAALEGVVEDCVNHVGVDLNTASAALLGRVAGLSPLLADNILQLRSTLGSFSNRQQLLKVPRLGPRAFEQCAGFLRIRNGDQPLDNTAVHPESYALVERIAALAGCSIETLLRSPERLHQLDTRALNAASCADYTLSDILKELEKPGRDPRPSFRSVSYNSQVETLEQLQIGMQLEGVVTNVTQFGAFIDIGVHQDGLVHISELADHFVKDIHSVISSGQIVQVRVLDVDLKRRRIALSMKKSASTN